MSAGHDLPGEAAVPLGELAPCLVCGDPLRDGERCPCLDTFSPGYADDVPEPCRACGRPLDPGTHRYCPSCWDARYEY